VGGACSTHGVLGGNPKEGDHSEDRGLGRRMGSEWTLMRLTAGM
jgi:hypothetical protein